MVKTPSTPWRKTAKKEMLSSQAMGDRRKAQLEQDSIIKNNELGQRRESKDEDPRLRFSHKGREERSHEFQLRQQARQELLRRRSSGGLSAASSKHQHHEANESSSKHQHHHIAATQASSVKSKSEDVSPLTAKRSGGQPAQVATDAPDSSLSRRLSGGVGDVDVLALQLEGKLEDKRNNKRNLVR